MFHFYSIAILIKDCETNGRKHGNAYINAEELRIAKQS